METAARWVWAGPWISSPSNFHQFPLATPRGFFSTKFNFNSPPHRITDFLTPSVPAASASRRSRPRFLPLRVSVSSSSAPLPAGSFQSTRRFFHPCLLRSKPDPSSPSPSPLVAGPVHDSVERQISVDTKHVKNWQFKRFLSTQFNYNLKSNPFPAILGIQTGQATN